MRPSRLHHDRYAVVRDRDGSYGVTDDDTGHLARFNGHLAGGMKLEQARLIARTLNAAYRQTTLDGSPAPAPGRRITDRPTVGYRQTPLLREQPGNPLTGDATDREIATHDATHREEITR